MENGRYISTHNLFEMETLLSRLEVLYFKFGLLMQYMPDSGLMLGALAFLDEIYGGLSDLKRDYDTLFCCVSDGHDMNSDFEN